MGYSGSQSLERHTITTGRRLSGGGLSLRGRQLHNRGGRRVVAERRDSEQLDAELRVLRAADRLADLPDVSFGAASLFSASPSSFKGEIRI